LLEDGVRVADLALLLAEDVARLHVVAVLHTNTEAGSRIPTVSTADSRGGGVSRRAARGRNPHLQFPAFPGLALGRLLAAGGSGRAFRALRRCTSFFSHYKRTLLVGAFAGMDAGRAGADAATQGRDDSARRATPMPNAKKSDKQAVVPGSILPMVTSSKRRSGRIQTIVKLRFRARAVTVAQFAGHQLQPARHSARAHLASRAQTAALRWAARECGAARGDAATMRRAPAAALLPLLLASATAPWEVPWGGGDRGAGARGPPPVGSGARFAAASEYVGLGGSSGAVVAVGDFDRDRSVDLVVLDTGRLSSLGVRLWRSAAYAFVESGRRGVVLGDGDCGVKSVEGVAVGDFNDDGKLDLLVTGGGSGCVFYGDGGGGFSEDVTVVPEVGLGGGLVMDADGDLVPELFVVHANGTRGFWQFFRDDGQDGSGEAAVVPAKARWHSWASGVPEECGAGGSVAVAPAFVDLDGDCLADLVVPTVCGLEVWSNPNQGGARVGSGGRRAFWEMEMDGDGVLWRREGEDVFNAAHGDALLVFSDFNGDGTMDIAVANRNRGDLLVFLNMQVYRPHGLLCTRDPAWKVSRRVGIEDGINLKPESIGPLFGRVEVPTGIRVGDYDLDGKPDLIVTDARSGSPLIYRNNGGWAEKDKSIEPHFVRIPENDALAKAAGKGSAVAAFFFDTDETGRQDVVVASSKNRTSLVWNSFITKSDSLFFKGTGLSAQPYRVVGSAPRPFAPVAGNTFKVSYMARNARGRVTRTCSQCPQSDPWALQVCSCLFGLLEISNYIEEMVVGAGVATRAWSNLTPNSMAVVWADTVSGWKMEYFTQRRGGQMLRVVAILIVTLGLLAGAVLYLQHQERKEDRESISEQQVPLFNFGAG
jgi:FG-GAP-like repeat